MVLCCDTSFLFSLYGNDAHTTRALEVVQDRQAPLTLSPFNEFELLNALRLAIFRQVLETAEADLIRDGFQTDLREGRLILVNCNLATVLTEAKRLSGEHSLAGGHRAFDILHVSAALVLAATHFLSFDDRQRALAVAAGLADRA